MNSLTCVCPLVDFQIFRSGKYFSTAGEWTGKRFLSGVHSDMIHKFVLSFKRLSLSWTFFPKTDMVRLLWSSNVLHSHMRHQFVHGAVSFGAKFLGGVLWLQPLADELLLDRLPHVTEKRASSVMVVVVVVCAEIHVQIESAVSVQRRSRERVCPGARYLTQMIRPNVHFGRYS